jgi:septal ring factor EnvC (AmiA/AmiB activator)
MSVQSSTQTMRTPRTDFVFPTFVAESLLLTEDQMHAHMDKARSAFERMSKKAQEAQAAKDKEIAELRKALALSEERVKAAENTLAIQKEASTEMEKALKARLEKTERERDSREERLNYLRKLYEKGTIGFWSAHGRTIEREWLPIVCCFEKAIGGTRGMLCGKIPIYCKHDGLPKT